MASKRGIKRRKCRNKKDYSKGEAIRSATLMRRKFPGEAFDGYKCSTCGHWHVGHRPKRVRLAISKRRQA